MNPKNRDNIHSPHAHFDPTSDAMLDHDTINRQVMQELQDLYQINGDDKQSVQRVWQRLLQEKQAEKRLHQPFSQKKILRAITQYPLIKSRRHTSVSITVLVALLILIGSTSIFSFFIQLNGKNQYASQKTSTAQENKHQQPYLLGKSLGSYFLGMTIDQLKQRKQPIAPGQFEWDKQHNIYNFKGQDVLITFENRNEEAISAATQISIWSPSQEQTREGFQINMTYDTFMQLVHPFTFQRHAILPPTFPPFPLAIKTANFLISITDTNGTVLFVVFDQRNRATQIVLQAKDFA